MARVVLVGNLVQLTGGAANFDLAATSVKHLFELLAERHPALAPHLAEGVAVAIDGQIYQDTLHEPIAPDSEVFVLPRSPAADRLHCCGSHSHARCWCWACWSWARLIRRPAPTECRAFHQLSSSPQHLFDEVAAWGTQAML